MPNEKQGSEQTKSKEGEGDKGLIEMDALTYNTLLDRLDTLEEFYEKSQGKGAKKEEDEDDDFELDDLLREAQEDKGAEDKGKKAGKKTQSVDFSKMKPEEVNGYILHLVQAAQNPLVVELHQMKLERQIERMLSETEIQEVVEGGVKVKKEVSKYADFMDYKDELYKIAVKNPQLTIKQCYKLAKDEVGEKSKNKKGEEGLQRRTLRHLPVSGSKAKGSTHSEFPGAAKGVTEEGTPKTLKEAASRAFDEVFGT